ncbi:MAG: MFS transporter [Parabacteroides johnsonii]|jgi:DHA2 family multidrug resistance protein-like MFS transporter|nr:MFS transporter [Parabacteroides johnsonii]
MISANRATTVNKTDGLPLLKRYWAILATALGVGMSVIDGTIANVALPTIARDLGTEPSVTIWVVNAYQLAITISLLSFSSLGDIYGYRRIYLSGIAVFSVTSLICALSDSFWTLTAARIMQGFGAAAITSVNTALLRIIYPKKFLGRGMGINALVVAVSIAAGPTIASAILSLGSWHWLFAINVPFGIAALVIGISHLPGNPVKVYGRRFDKVSCLMNALTFGLLIFSLEGIAHKQSVVLVIGGIVALGIIGYFFVRRQLRQRFPLLPVDLMRIPIFSLSIGTSISSFTAQMLAMISLPFFLQNTLGRSDVATGLLLTPWPLATMIMAPTAGRLVEKIHPGILGGIGMGIFATGLFLLATLPVHPTDMDIIWRLFVCGAGFGLFQTPNNSTIISSAPTNRSGGASGMLGTARLLGQTLGATLVAMIFNLMPSNSTHACLYLATGFAVIAAIVSCLRISQPRPLKGTECQESSATDLQKRKSSG